MNALIPPAPHGDSGSEAPGAGGAGDAAPPPAPPSAVDGGAAAVVAADAAVDAAAVDGAGTLSAGVANQGAVATDAGTPGALPAAAAAAAPPAAPPAATVSTVPTVPVPASDGRGGGATAGDGMAVDGPTGADAAGGVGAGALAQPPVAGAGAPAVPMAAPVGLGDPGVGASGFAPPVPVPAQAASPTVAAATTATTAASPAGPPGVAAPGQQPQPQPQPAMGKQIRELKVEDALQYLDQVKTEFQHESKIYNEFLDIMKKFKTHAIDTPGVMDHVSKLFRGNNKLILGFNTFLPDGYKIDLNSIEESNRRSDEEAASSGGVSAAMQQQRAMYGNGGGMMMQGRVPEFPPGAGDGGPRMIPNAAAPQAQSRFQPPQMPNPNAPQAGGAPGAGGDKPQIEFKRAINYVTKIKKTFNDDQDTYKRFLEILHTYQKEQKPTGIEEVLEQVRNIWDKSIEWTNGKGSERAKARAKKCKEEGEGTVTSERRGRLLLACFRSLPASRFSVPLILIFLPSFLPSVRPCFLSRCRTFSRTTRTC